MLRGTKSALRRRRAADWRRGDLAVLGCSVRKTSARTTSCTRCREVSALHAGVSHRAVVKLLIAGSGAPSMQEGATGRRRSWTPARRAIWRLPGSCCGHARQDPHAEDRDGHTALEGAREHGHDKVAALVEDRGGLPGLKKRRAAEDVEHGRWGVETCRSRKTRATASTRRRARPRHHAIASRSRPSRARIGGDRRPDPAAARDAWICQEAA